MYVHNVVTEQISEGRSSEFEAVMQNGDKAMLRSFCDRKSQESKYVTCIVKAIFCFLVRIIFSFILADLRMTKKHGNS